jgi:two-component system NtrC family sensor kinase
MSPTNSAANDFETPFHEVLQAIASALTPDEALKQITDGARRVFGVEFAIIWTLQGDDLVPAAWAGFAEEEVRTLQFKVGRGVAGQAALGSDLVETDISRESKELYMPLAKKHGLTLALHVPLRYQRVLKGVMAIADRGMRSMAADRRRALKTFAAFAAIALGNAQEFGSARRAEQEERDIFASIQDPMYLVDREGRIVRVNPRVEAVLKVSASELAGQSSWSSILGLPERSRAPEIEAMGTGRHVDREIESRPLGGSFAVSASPLRDAAGRVTGCVVGARDMTERRRLERQLAETEKLTAIGRLVSGVAHELNNPLSSVIGFSDLVARDPSSPTVPERLRIISDEARRAAKIVRNLLTFARQQKPERAACRLEEMVQRVLDLMAYDLRTGGIKVVTDFPADSPEVMVDASQMQQVAINLLSNAAFAIREQNRPGMIWIRLRPRERWLQFIVEDDGPGIAPSVMDHLFEPFVTSKAVGKGTGLGLSVCYGIVREHGGQIRGEQRPGGGARFVVELPLDGTPASTTARMTADSPETPGLLRTARNLRVLVLDDEPSILEFVRACFGESNVVNAVSDVRAALALLEKNEFDVVLSDIKMPGLNGREFYNFLVRQQGTLADRVIFMTGDVLNEETREFFETFELPHLEKPFQRRDLLKAVVSLVNRA